MSENNAITTISLPFSGGEVDIRRPLKKDIFDCRQKMKSGMEDISNDLAVRLVVEIRDKDGTAQEKITAKTFDEMDMEDWNVIDEHLENAITLGKKKVPMSGM